MGHGRAIRHLREHGDAGLQVILKQACLRNTLFDHQFEDLKGLFLADALLATGRPDEYVSELIALSGRIRSSRDLDQWADLIGHLAIADIEPARRYLQDAWAADLACGENRFASAYIKWGGHTSYREVLNAAEQVWRKRKRPINYAFSLHYEADDAMGKKRAQRIRDPIEERNPKFAKWADFPGLPQKEYSPPPKESVEDRVRKGRYVPLANLTPEDIETVARLLREGLTERPLRIALRFFRKVEFPRPLDTLYRYLDSEDASTKFLALGALGKNRDPEVRELAFKHADDPYLRSEAIEILRSNFAPGDEQWIEQQFRRPNNPNWHHWSIISIRQVIEENPKGKWPPLLHYMLDAVPCQLCRGGVAEELRKRRALADEELAALCYDADSGVRKWARKLRKRELVRDA